MHSICSLEIIVCSVIKVVVSLCLKPNQCCKSNSNSSWASEQLAPTQRSSMFQTSSYNMRSIPLILFIVRGSLKLRMNVV